MKDHEQLAMFSPGEGGRETVRRHYPWGPGAQILETSQQAAEEIAPSVDTLRERALLVIRLSEDGLTADEVADAMGETVLTIRPRISELGKLGYIEDSGQRRPNASGRMAAVWKYIGGERGQHE